MAKAIREMMTIAFPRGGILPRDITGTGDTPVQAHIPVAVPRYYGEHLIHDRLAYEVQADVVVAGPAGDDKTGKSASSDDDADKSGKSDDDASKTGKAS